MVATTRSAVACACSRSQRTATTTLSWRSPRDAGLITWGGEADAERLLKGERSYSRVELFEVAGRDQGQTFIRWVASMKENEDRRRDEEEFERLKKKLGR